jgi:branched-chain amino acid transport system substrate-binding protein
MPDDDSDRAQMPGRSAGPARRGFLPARWRVGVLAAIAACLVASCGSSASNGNSASSGGANSSGGIPVGVIGSFTGSQAASTAPARPAIEAWAASVNAAGGLDGHKINLIVVDDGGVASTALADVRQLIEQNHVVVLVNDWSAASDQWGGYAQQQGVPIVGGYEQLATSSDFFPAGTTNTPLLQVAYRAGLAKGATKIALAYCAEVAACSAQVPASQAATAAIGSQRLVWHGSFSSTAPSYTAQCLAAKDSGADGMFVSDASDAIIKFATACAQQGFRPQELSLDGTMTTNWLTVSALNGTVAAEEDAPWFLTSTPALAAFHNAMKKYQPSATITSASMQAWAAGQLFAAAYKAAGAPANASSADILKGLYSLKNETLGGIAPPLNFVKGQPTAVKCAFVVGIESGKFVAPNGLKLTCAS